MGFTVFGATRNAIITSMLLGAAACGGSQPLGSTRTWIGHLDGTDGALAIRIGDSNKLTAYVCGGPSTLKTLTHWMSGHADDDQKLSASHPDGATLSGSLEPDSASGVLSMAGLPDRRFTARAIDSGLAGLYDANDSGCRTGVIVFANAVGTEPSLIGAWCNADGRVSEVTPIAPVAMNAAGFAVQAEGPDGVRTMTVRPVEP